MDGPGSETFSFVSERFVVRILAGISIVLTEIAFFLIQGLILGGGIGSSEM
jgi:hypothetical protein